MTAMLIKIVLKCNTSKIWYTDFSNCLIIPGRYLFEESCIRRFLIQRKCSLIFILEWTWICNNWKLIIQYRLDPTQHQSNPQLNPVFTFGVYLGFTLGLLGEVIFYSYILIHSVNLHMMNIEHMFEHIHATCIYILYL